MIGGYCGGGDWTGTVELFQVKTRRWYKLTNIPQPLTFPSATLCGNQLHVIGWDDKGYTCSIPSSDEPITSQLIPHLISWTPLPRLPVTYSTAATLYGQLVISSGIQGRLTVNSIHQLVDVLMNFARASCREGSLLCIIKLNFNPFGQCTKFLFRFVLLLCRCFLLSSYAGHSSKK